MQRVLEQRVTAILDKLLVKPSLVNLPSMEEGGLLFVSIINHPTSLLSSKCQFRPHADLYVICIWFEAAVSSNASSGV
jgi:hypothetical protein